ncbi:hypothetical protein [Halobacillus aidingensis]|uniref:Uncharacterized protein n=1 Tax=Halobacillus aidingensis TaxID=240303 RepID=A0A1H0I9V2_HALAD|nr:hypothetical protein [Halobacillus aidingensis]SDO28163.1 hypothetical protein SAMN05421677_10419 [Halobacillus aidingensis]
MEIIPYTSAGPLRINMRKEEVREVMNEPPIEFVRDEDEPTSDHFVKSGVFSYYKEDEETNNAYEFTAPAEVTCKGISFLNMRERKAKKLFKKLDPDFVDFEETFISLEHGISLFFMDHKVETVLVFERNYYDDLFEELKKLDEI